jgi:hypothetical protein
LPGNSLYISFFISNPSIQKPREADTGMAGKAAGASNVTFFYEPHKITIQECTELPCMVHSPGLWNYYRSGTVGYSLPLLQLQMALIFFMNQLIHYGVKRYGVPKFTSQIIVCVPFLFHLSTSSLLVSLI